MPRRSPSYSPSPTSTSTYAKSPPLTIVRLKLPPSQSEQGSSNGMKWSFSIIQMENLHKQTSAQKKTNGNKPWKIKKPKRKFTRARHCRCAVCRCRLPFPALLHCFISQKFRTNRGALKANEPQVCPSHSLPPSAAVRMKKTTQLRSQ